MILIIYAIFISHISLIIQNLVTIDNVIAAAIFNQVTDPNTWRNLSHVNRATYRVSKLLLVEKCIIPDKGNIDNFIKLLNIFPHNKINKCDISKITYYVLPNNIKYGQTYIFETLGFLSHIYNVKSNIDDPTKTMCRTLFLGTTSIYKETQYLSESLSVFREHYKDDSLKLKINYITIKLHHIKINQGQLIPFLIKRHGQAWKWSNSGILLSDMNYYQGVRHGPCKTFRANSTLRYNYIYDNSKIIYFEMWNKKGNRILNPYCKHQIKL